jgi:hypothetical protein
MLDGNRVEEIVAEICESYVRKRNGNGFNARCPVCGDSQKSKRIRRLHVDWYQRYESWVCTCYNGGCPFRSGNIYSLYSTVTGQSYSDTKKYINQEVYNTDEIKRRLANKKIAPPVEDTGDQVLDLDMNDCLSFRDNPDDKVEIRHVVALQQFMLKRHIRKPCFVAFKGRYKGRFIIPIYINKKMVYFQGRAMLSIIDPKYLNPVVDKSSICMNIDNISRDMSIVVTEGIIDAWMVEDNQGTSVLGAHFDDEKIGRLLTMTDKDVILCFDNPLIDNSGREEILKFIAHSRFKDKVKFFLPKRTDFKDLNDLRSIIKGNMYNYIIDNSFSSLNVKVKLSL